MRFYPFLFRRMNAARLFYCKVVTAEPPVELHHKHSWVHGSAQQMPAASV